MRYVVVVRARNDYSESKAVVAPLPIRVYSSEKPVAPDAVSAFYYQDLNTNQINLDYIFVPGEYRYKVRYKLLTDSEWSTYPYNNYIYETEDISEPLSVNIENISSWKGYKVKICAVSGDGREGDYWESQILEPKLFVPTFTMAEDNMSIIVSSIYSKEGERMYKVELEGDNGSGGSGFNEIDIWDTVFGTSSWVIDELNRW